MKANVYVDDILMAAVFRANILRLLAATIEGIFLVCGRPDVSLRQCPLSLEKWLELRAHSGSNPNRSGSLSGHE